MSFRTIKKYLSTVLLVSATIIISSVAYGDAIYENPIVRVDNTSPSLQATAPVLSVSLFSTDNTCAGSAFIIDWGYTGEVDDTASGFDRVGMIAFDANGVSIASDWNGAMVGSSSNRNVVFGVSAGINQITARPIRVEIYDIVNRPDFGLNTQAIFDQIMAQVPPSPLMLSLDYDPSIDVPDCASLPTNTLGGPVAISTLSNFGMILLAFLFMGVAAFVFPRGSYQ